MNNRDSILKLRDKVNQSIIGQEAVAEQEA